ncbi:putative protein FMP32, mitochondrial [Cocos nucifera]|uniref:DUF8204 domain-containing protein n=1 Tax=Cocos nucifera TaxID=13894 RepID=A0A8K0IFH6_COCNU|nr:putative protein FMP32, mitochondrial [Cocos nucifera]
MEEDSSVGGGDPRQSPGRAPNPKAKSCKGCLFYSSVLKSEARNPLCVGITRNLQQDLVSSNEEQNQDNVVGQCYFGNKIGIKLDSAYADDEILMDRRTSTADHMPAHVHNKEVLISLELHHDKCEGSCSDMILPTFAVNDGSLRTPENFNSSNAPLHSRPQGYGPTTSSGQDFFGKFARNAGLVASGVARNLIRVRRLEAEGVPSKHAEAITSAITEVLNDSLENVSQSFVSKGEMQKSEMIQDASLGKFKSEVKSSQEHHFSLLQRETEKLRGDIEKMRSELRYEIDKVTAGQRLDLNLERGRIRDELAKQSAETTDLTTKLDREIHALRAHLEAAKYDVIKYCIGTLVSISAVGLAVIRILM